MKEESSKILDNITTIRNSKGYTQDYIAGKLGMKQAGYALIEKGSRGLQIDMLEQIAIIFDMDIVDVIKYPLKYEKMGSQKKVTKVMIELEVSDDEFIKFGLKDKLLQILDK